MKTIKYSLAIFLLTAAGMLAVLGLLWAFEVWHVGAPGEHKLAAFAWQLAVFTVLASALASGGVALLQTSRERQKPRERMPWAQIEKILIVAQDGNELLALMDTEREAAKVILDGAFLGTPDREILHAAIQQFQQNYEGGYVPELVTRAIAQAKALYAGVGGKKP